MNIDEQEQSRRALKLGWSKLELQGISESKLARIWQNVEERATPFGMITVYRGELDQKENRARNKQLRTAFRGQGYGFIVLDGSYVEETPDGKGTPVKEESMFVVGTEGDTEGFIKFMVSQCARYGQDSVLVGEGAGGVFGLYNKEGSFIMQLGKFYPSKIGYYHSHLRGHGKRVFQFESITLPLAGNGFYAAARARNFGWHRQQQVNEKDASIQI